MKRKKYYTRKEVKDLIKNRLNIIFPELEKIKDDVFHKGSYDDAELLRGDRLESQRDKLKYILKALDKRKPLRKLYYIFLENYKIIEKGGKIINSD